MKNVDRRDEMAEDELPVRAYRCDYGWWHTTGSPYRPSPRGTGGQS